MTPSQLAKSGTEHAHQRALFAWCAMAQLHGPAAAWDDECYGSGGMAYAFKWYGKHIAVPELADFYAIPNGGERNKAVAAKLKAEGVKPGTPDTHLPVACGQYHSLYIEMKKPGGSVSSSQKKRFEQLTAYGNFVAVCYTWQEAVIVISNYLQLPGYSGVDIASYLKI